jgi:hypothetical protein
MVAPVGRRTRRSSWRGSASYRKTGSLVTARLRGRFSSKAKANANLYLPAECDGVGGRITLELR